MPFIAAPVAIWVAGAATAAGFVGSAATIGAIAGAVASGVVAGAVIGAAGAAIQGGDILDGAIKGAVIGGVSAGVFSGLGMATGFATTTEQLGAMGVNQTATGMLDVGAGVGTGVTEASTGALETGAGAVEAGTGAIADPVAAQPAAQPAAERTLMSKIFLDSSGSLSDTSGRVLASGIEGAAKAMLTEAPDETPVESQSEYLAQVQAMNASGDFQRRVANIKVPTSWQKYTKVPPTPVNPSIKPATTTTPVTTPQGGTYAPA